MFKYVNFSLKVNPLKTAKCAIFNTHISKIRAVTFLISEILGKKLVVKLKLSTSKHQNNPSTDKYLSPVS